MQTTFEGPFRAGATTADKASYDDRIVAMRTEDEGLELLGEDVTLLLSADDVRTLLFYGSTVELEGPGGATASVSVDPRRYAVVLLLDGRTYRAPRWAITAVARGRLPAAYLQDRRRSAVPSAPAVRTMARRMTEVGG